MAGLQVLLQRMWSQEIRLWGREPWGHGILVWPLRGSGNCGHMGSSCCLIREAIKNRILEAIWTRLANHLSHVTTSVSIMHLSPLNLEAASSSMTSDCHTTGLGGARESPVTCVPLSPVHWVHVPSSAVHRRKW